MNPLDADRRGHTHDEAERLAWLPERWSLQGFRGHGVCGPVLGRHVVARYPLGAGNRIRSGSSLDDIYRNQALGTGAFGRFADRPYLDSIGWRGMRVRREHMNQTLRDAMYRLRDAGLPVNTLDIAVGHGRYVLETRVIRCDAADSILLRDFSDLDFTVSLAQRIEE